MVLNLHHPKRPPARIHFTHCEATSALWSVAKETSQKNFAGTPDTTKTERDSRTDAERVRYATAAVDHPALREYTTQRAQDLLALPADPPILLRITHPQPLRKRAQKVHVELSHPLHLVVRHRQRRVNGRGRL